jgi:hypothetical protein
MTTNHPKVNPIIKTIQQIETGHSNSAASENGIDRGLI